jgi:hypothetical protein
MQLNKTSEQAIASIVYNGMNDYPLPVYCSMFPNHLSNVTQNDQFCIS